MRDAPGPKLKNYITPAGLQRLKDEHRFLMSRERPTVTQVVAWAAGNGDRSENADYLYGKRRLRQIDSRIRFLTKRIDAAEVVDPAAPRSGSAAGRVFFGATVTYKDAGGQEHVVSIVGIDEVDLDRRYISWMSPLAKALMKYAADSKPTAKGPTPKAPPTTSKAPATAAHLPPGLASKPADHPGRVGWLKEHSAQPQPAPPQKGTKTKGDDLEERLNRLAAEIEELRKALRKK